MFENRSLGVGAGESAGLISLPRDGHDASQKPAVGHLVNPASNAAPRRVSIVVILAPQDDPSAPARAQNPRFSPPRALDLCRV